MSDVEIAQQSARASAILFAGNLAASLLAAVALFVIARLLGPDEYGVYTLTFLIPAAFQLVAGFGVNLAVARYAAFYSAKGDLQSARRITFHAILFLLLVGTAMAAVNYLGAGFAAASLLKRPELTPYIQLASLYIIGQTLLFGAVTALIGWNSPAYSSLSTIIQAVLKVGMSVALVLLGFGVFGAISGQIGSYVVGGLIAVGILFFSKLRGYKADYRRFGPDVKMMVIYGFPLFFGNVVSGLSAQYLAVILATIAGNVVVGYYQAAVNATVLISLTLTAVESALFQAFSRLEGTDNDLALALRLGVKYVSFLAAPLIVFIAAASGPLLDLFYGGSYSGGAGYLQLLAISFLPVVLGLNVMSQFFNGVGKTRFTMVVLISSAAVLSLLVTAFSVVLGLGILGLLWANILANLASACVGLVLSMKYMDARIEIRGALGISLASAAGYFVTVWIDSFAGSTDFRVFIDAIVFAAVYLTVAPLFGVLREADFKRLQTAIAGFGRVRWPLGMVIRYERKVFGLVHRETNLVPD